eukprot:Rhum_TRINITY_DN14540_c0_g2::Rhum_TRINITY_DN14540_c0_g2_i1::g.96318::m.96318
MLWTAAEALQSDPPSPSARMRSTAGEAEKTAPCVAEEQKDCSSANSSDHLCDRWIWARAGTWPREYTLSPWGECGYSTHTARDGSQVRASPTSAAPTTMRRTWAQQAGRHEDDDDDDAGWTDAAGWWLGRWVETPGLVGGAWCWPELRRPGAWCRSRWFSRRARRTLRQRERLLRRLVRILRRQLCEAVLLHPFSMRGGCSADGADADTAVDALLAEVGATRRAVVSNDDCGYVALHGGTEDSVAVVSDDNVTELREELATFTATRRPVAGLFPSEDAFSAYVDDIRDRGWMDALTLHLAAALWRHRIVVVQGGEHPVVCISPPAASCAATPADRKRAAGTRREHAGEKIGENHLVPFF